jgi:hypothetical protein
MTLGTTRSDAASDSPSIDEASDADLLGPLLEGTVRNLQGTAPAAERTGPVARGDEDTFGGAPRGAPPASSRSAARLRGVDDRNGASGRPHRPPVFGGGRSLA